MKLVRLTPGTVLDVFDCSDDDLKNFLVEDAKGFFGPFPKLIFRVCRVSSAAVYNFSIVL